MGKILRIAMLFVSFIILFSPAWAQNGGGTVVRGTVTDEKGGTLPGVTVTAKGTKVSVITNVDGVYSINVPAGTTTLVFRFVGMESKEVAIGGRTQINVGLSATTTSLAQVDVVSIGYGTQKRQDVNGAISSITAAQIADIPQPSIDQMLQGQAAGVTVTNNSGQPGSATSVHIRGITSFTNSEPLYVIDGVEIEGNSGPQALNSPGSSNQEITVSPLALLNPDDIESVDILKDASATAIYGSRGSNGVVIVTTKHGKSGQAKVTYDGFVGMQQQGKFLKMMDLQQYATLENQLSAVYRTQPRAEFADPSVLGPGTNWQDVIFRNSLETSHNVSVSGGNDKSDYYVSGGYFKQDGTIMGFNFDRYSIRSVVNSQVKNWLKIGSVIGASRSDQNMSLGDNTGIVYDALLAAPDQAVYNADGSFAGPYVTSNGTREGGPNPIQLAKSVSNTLTRNDINGNLYANINFFKDLYLRSEVDGDFVWSNAQTFNPSYSYGATGTPTQYLISNPTATLYRNVFSSSYWTWKESLNYNHTWGKSSLQAQVGHEVWESKYDSFNLTGSGFIAGNQLQSIALATNDGTIAESEGTTTMESVFGRIIYTFNNRYSITANMRSDRSSNFAFGHQVGYFPGAAISWRLSEESFMAGIKRVADNIKIRAGLGTTGNSNIQQYAYGASLTATPTAFGTSFRIANVANPDLKWETAIQKDLGVDFTLFNRIDGAFDWYDKTSSNFLFQKPLPYFLLGGPNEYGDNPAGIAPPYVNAGEIQNKGFEFSITSRNIVTKDFKWSTTLNFSHYANKVVSLNGAPAINQSITTAYVTLPVTSTIVGQPVGEFYGYKVQGIVKSQSQLQYLSTHPQNVAGYNQVVTNDPNNTQSIWLGDIEYQDTNHDGKVDANDRVPLGNPNPDFTYGFTNTFTYKNFDLSVFLYGSYGGKILNVLDYEIAGLASQYQNQLASVANYWTPQNPNSNIPAPRSGITNPNLVMSDRFLESASFLRFQNVRLGYSLPTAWAKYVAMSTLKVYLSGQNLFVITKYSGLDPEVGSYNQNPTMQNIDMGRYPNPRVFTFGVNASF